MSLCLHLIMSGASVHNASIDRSRLSNGPQPDFSAYTNRGEYVLWSRPMTIIAEMLEPNATLMPSILYTFIFQFSHPTHCILCVLLQELFCLIHLGG